jgi:hypothetical protein
MFCSGRVFSRSCLSFATFSINRFLARLFISEIIQKIFPSKPRPGALQQVAERLVATETRRS